MRRTVAIEAGPLAAWHVHALAYHLSHRTAQLMSSSSKRKRSIQPGEESSPHQDVRHEAGFQRHAQTGTKGGLEDELEAEIRRLELIVAQRDQQLTESKNQTATIMEENVRLQQCLDAKEQSKWRMATDMSEILRRLDDSMGACDELRQTEQSHKDEINRLQMELASTIDKLKQRDQKIKELTKENKNARRVGQDEVLDEWREVMSSELAFEIVVGLQLTRNQMNGVRWSMAYKYKNGKYCRKKLQCRKDVNIPCMPSWWTVSKEKTRLAEEYGIQSHQSGAGLDILSTVTMAKNKGKHWKADGKYHMQFLADAFRQYRNSSMCNFGIRCLSGDPSCRNLTNVCCQGERIQYTLNNQPLQTIILSLIYR